MNTKYTRALIILIIIILMYKGFRRFFDEKPVGHIVVMENGEKVEKVQISVYYEALCPDSKFFITYQLQPVFDDLKDNLIIDLIPYGKAETIIDKDGKITFQCQHYATECFANKIHACVIDQVKDPMQQLQYIACMISDNMIPEEAGEKCGNSLNIDFTPIKNCAVDEKGSVLLKQHGERTHALNPSIRFVPTIELNGSQTLQPQAAILKDLSKAVCEVFKEKPQKCDE